MLATAIPWSSGADAFCALPTRAHIATQSNDLPIKTKFENLGFRIEFPVGASS
jgi:hypothetical protein